MVTIILSVVNYIVALIIHYDNHVECPRGHPYFVGEVSKLEAACL